MTRDDEFIGQLKGYLDEYEGLTPLPDVVRNSVRAQLPTTKQIGPVSGLMRDLYMNRSIDTPARWGLVAAVIIGAVIIGGALFLGGNNVGGPPASSPFPSVEPSAAPTTPPGPAAAVDFSGLDVSALTPGSYVFTHVPPVRVTFTVPAGWEKFPPDWVVWSTDNIKATLAVVSVDNLYADPCDSQLLFRDPAVGPTVADLAAALGTVPGLTFSAPTDVNVAGFDGLQLDYAPPDTFGACSAGEPLLWSVNRGTDVQPAPGGDDVFTIRILDVNGTRLVITTAHGPGVPEIRVAELEAILDSIQIE